VLVSLLVMLQKTLCSLKRHTMEAFGGRKVYLKALLTWHEIEVSGRLYVRASPGERVQGQRHRKLGGPQSRFGRWRSGRH